jgi:hypothetical protein
MIWFVHGTDLEATLGMVNDVNPQIVKIECEDLHQQKLNFYGLRFTLPCEPHVGDVICPKNNRSIYFEVRKRTYAPEMISSNRIIGRILLYGSFKEDKL